MLRYAAMRTTPLTLRRTREALGLSQAELEKAAKLPQSSLCRIETGTRVLSDETVLALLDAMDALWKRRVNTGTKLLGSLRKSVTG